MLNLRNPTRRRRALAAAAFSTIVISAILVLSLATTGDGAASGSGISQVDDALLGSVLQGMSTDLASVTLGTPTSDFTDIGTSKWLNVTHKAGQTPAENAQDAWYAYLIAGAYDAQCAAQGADCLDGYTLVGSDGPGADDGSGRLVMQSVAIRSESQQDISNTIDQRLAAERITASSISFEKPYGFAPIVEIQSSDPQTTINDLNAGSVFSGLGLDGYLVRITDSGGNVMLVEDAAFRSQAGQGWVAPSLTLPNVP